MGAFTYSRNIPNPSDSPSFDVTLMQQNAQSINDLVAIDHQGFNTNTLIGGYHSKVTFPVAQTVPTLAASQTQIYPQTFGTGATSYLETYTSAALQGGSQINGYLPFVKCIVSFQSLGANGVITATAGYLSANIGSIVQSTTSVVGDTITVNFATALPSNTYYIFYSTDTNEILPITKNTANIVFNSPGTIPNTFVFSFMVI